MYVLRKSWNQWSAGTRVEPIKLAEERDFPPGAVNPGYSTIRTPDGKVVDIEHDLIVKRRDKVRRVDVA